MGGLFWGMAPRNLPFPGKNVTGARRRCGGARARFRRPRADLPGSLALPLPLEIFEVGRSIDHPPSAGLANENGADLALLDQLRLCAAARPEQALERLTERHEG